MIESSNGGFFMGYKGLLRAFRRYSLLVMLAPLILIARDPHQKNFQPQGENSLPSSQRLPSDPPPFQANPADRQKFEAFKDVRDWFSSDPKYGKGRALDEFRRSSEERIQNLISGFERLQDYPSRKAFNENTLADLTSDTHFKREELGKKIEELRAKGERNLELSEEAQRLLTAERLMVQSLIKIHEKKLQQATDAGDKEGFKQYSNSLLSLKNHRKSLE